MKKAILSVLSLTFLFSIALAQRPDMPNREEMKKDFKEMSALVDSYNKEKSKKKKAQIEEQIKAKVSTNYDRHLKRMEERIKKSEERLDKAKEMLEKSQTQEAKDKHIQEVTKKILSGEKPMLFAPPQKDFNMMKDDKFRGKRMQKCMHEMGDMDDMMMPPPPPPPPADEIEK